MTTVAMVATTTTLEPPEALGARLRGLLEAGWGVHLICKGRRWAERDELRGRELAGHVDFIAGGDGLAPWASGDRRLQRRLREMRPDLIHFHSGSAAGKAIGLRAQLGCPIAVSLRADGADLGEPDAESLWREGDLFLFTDPAVLARAVARGCPRERSEILPPLLIRATPDQEPPSGRPGRPGPGRPLRILSSGPLVWERGLEHSAHAVRLAIDRGVGCRYRIMGGGADLTAVAFARHQLGLAGQVEIAAADSAGSLAEALGEADVFVDAAVADTSPTPLLAAQALGLPYVATERDGLAEGAGMIVPRRDPHAIADALVTLARDSELRMRMGAVGRAQGDYSAMLEADLRRLQNLYRRALGRA